MKYTVLENDDFIQGLGICEGIKMAYGIAYDFLCEVTNMANSEPEDTVIHAPYELEEQAGYRIIGENLKENLKFTVDILEIREDEVHL